jgi:hypothetical protein
MSERKIEYKDYSAIMMELQENHTIFYKMLELGVPKFTTEIDTAAVSFDKEGKCINFLFNPEFWEKSTPYELKFIIAHECLHVLLKHGLRLKNAKHKKIVNIAADIVINHTLVRDFSFNRNLLSFNDKLCWVDTIFPNEKNVPEDKTVEYYYTKIMKTADRNIANMDSIDSHEYLVGISEDEIMGTEQVKQILEDSGKSPQEINEDLKQLANVYEKLSEGIDEGKTFKMLNAKPQITHRWEDIIQKWNTKKKPSRLKKMKTKNSEHDCWVRVARRFAFLDTHMILPSTDTSEHVWNHYYDHKENKTGNKEKVKDLQLWFFMDVSGSCYGYIDHFYRALKSIDIGIFSIKAFAFDMKIKPIPITSKPIDLEVGGGTCFRIIEDYISSNSLKYPEAVFIITDGWGTEVTPQYPDRWYWFLTAENASKRYIHEDSYTYLLKDFYNDI